MLSFSHFWWPVKLNISQFEWLNVPYRWDNPERRQPSYIFQVLSGLFKQAYVECCRYNWRKLYGHESNQLKAEDFITKVCKSQVSALDERSSFRRRMHNSLSPKADKETSNVFILRNLNFTRFTNHTFVI